MTIHIYPERIETASLALFAVTEKMRQLRERLQEIEDAVTVEVLTARDEATGKPLFTNDTMREVTKRERLRARQDYVDLTDQLNVEERKRVETEAHLESLRREFRIALIEFEAEKLGGRSVV